MMSTNAFQIKEVMAALAQIAWDTREETLPGWRNPVRHLVRQALLYPPAHAYLCRRIALGEQVEFRLNGAGLKLRAHKHYDKRGKVSIRVGGGAAQYPRFVAEANLWLEGQGY